MRTTNKLRRLVVISRAGWIKHDGVPYFQDNDGFYLDGIAGQFDAVDVVSQEFVPGSAAFLSYGYQFKSTHIRLLPGMEPMSLRHPFRWFQQFAAIMHIICMADLVYSFVNTLRGSLYLLIASILFHKPTIAYNGTDRDALLRVSDMKGFRAWIRLVLERSAMRRADARIVTGAALYSRYEGLPLTFMTAPISAAIRACPFPTPRQCSKGSELRLLCVAHLRSQKNISVLIRACRILKDEGMAYCLNIVGDGSAKPDLRHAVESLGISDRVCFHGYVNDPTALVNHYRNNDIFLFASTVEGFPRAVWEAVHFGLYVITSRVGGVDMLFSKNVMTILGRPEPEEYAKAILAIAAEPERRRVAAEAARARLLSLFEFDPFQQFEQCLEAFADL
jgi:glycosyltransferase involved in cell wall biosynthesis